MSHSVTAKVWLMVCAALVASAAPAADVTVSGSHNVGIGTMNGGTVQLGLTPQEVQALATATGKELEKQLTAIAKRLNARPDANARRDSISLGVVEAFLMNTKGKKIPQDEWSAVFREMTRDYFQLGAQIAATPVTSDKIKHLVSKADAARKIGQFDEADRWLAEAADIAILDAQRVEQQALESKRQAASLLASRATLAFTRLERRQGAALLEKAFELRKGDASSETVGWLFHAGDAWLTEGQSAAALRAYQAAHDAANASLAVEPTNTQWQRDLAVSYDRIGDIQTRQGDSAAALKSYQASLTIAERLAASDPRNTEWQRDLSVSYNNIGNVQISRDDSPAALKSYQASLTIAERLAASDPRNTGWQHGLAVSYNRIGDVQATSQDDSPAVLKSYQSSLTIIERLAASDPRNTGWQRDLSVSYGRIGNVQASQGDSAAALKSYQSSLTILERLAASDPRNTGWQRDLWVSYNNIGDIQATQGDSAAALKSYQDGLAIAERLAASDSRNTKWQRDLAVFYWKLARVRAVAGSVEARRALLQKGLDILIRQRDSNQLPPSDVVFIKAFQNEMQALK